MYGRTGSSDSPGKSAKSDTRLASLQELLSWTTADTTPVGVKLRLVKLLQLVPHQVCDWAIILLNHHVLYTTNITHAVDLYIMLSYLTMTYVLQLVLDSLLPLGESILADCGSPGVTQTHLDILAILLDRMDETLAPTLTIDSLAYKFLVGCIHGNQCSVDGSSPQQLALKVVSLNT